MLGAMDRTRKGLATLAFAEGGRRFDPVQLHHSNPPLECLHRPPMPEDKVLRILEYERGVGLEPDCLDALIAELERGAVPDAVERAA